MLGGLRADWDFSQISRKATAVYGPLGQGQQRIDAWQRLLASEKQVSEQDQLKVVNLFFNKQMTYVEDIDLWHVVDYWETPVEALWKGAGDCEDYAIAKYFSLRHLGVSSDKLRITYVKAFGSTGDKLDHLTFMHQRYTADTVDYTGRVTVPVAAAAVVACSA